MIVIMHCINNDVYARDDPYLYVYCASMHSCNSTWHNWVWLKGVADRSTRFVALVPFSSFLKAKEDRFSHIPDTVMMHNVLTCTSRYDV